MSTEDLVRWYESTYPDDPDAYGSDFWIIKGYYNGIDKLGLYQDVWDAFQDYEVIQRLSHANSWDMRRFARSYEKGVADRPVIVQGKLIPRQTNLPKPRP